MTEHSLAALQLCRVATKERNSSLALHVASTRARCDAGASTFEQSCGVVHGSGVAGAAAAEAGADTTAGGSLGEATGVGVGATGSAATLGVGGAAVSAEG